MQASALVCKTLWLLKGVNRYPENLQRIAYSAPPHQPFLATIQLWICGYEVARLATDLYSVSGWTETASDSPRRRSPQSLVASSNYCSRQEQSPDFSSSWPKLAATV